MALNVKRLPAPVVEVEVSPRVESRMATRLLRSVLTKSVLEIIFVCVVASFAGFSNFNPLLRGAIDTADQTRVTGWAYDPHAADDALEVQLFIDGRFAASQRAGQPRPDVVQAKVAASPNHGFTFAFEPHLVPGKHTAQVYVLRRTAGMHKMLLSLSKRPVTFYVNH